MKIGKIVDVKGACCLDTTITPIKDAIATMKSNEVLEVLIRANLRKW